MFNCSVDGGGFSTMSCTRSAFVGFGGATEITGAAVVGFGGCGADFGGNGGGGVVVGGDCEGFGFEISNSGGGVSIDNDCIGSGERVDSPTLVDAISPLESVPRFQLQIARANSKSQMTCTRSEFVVFSGVAVVGFGSGGADFGNGSGGGGDSAFDCDGGTDFDSGDSDGGGDGGGGGGEGEVGG